MFHSAQGLVAGNEPSVGVRHFKATSEHPPLRIFYPAEQRQQPEQPSSPPNPVGWFDENGLGFYLSGYAHVYAARSHTRLFRWLVLPAVYLLSFFLPARYMKLPGVSYDAPFRVGSNDGTTTKRPIVIFSHGLTGTGEENSILCAGWAKRGFVVVSVRHLDGSSCRATKADGTSRYYDHGPPFRRYDPTFRPRQVKRRAKEMCDACAFLESEECPREIREGIDLNRIFASGFSYGAATAILANLRSPVGRFRGLVLLDGWFYIDVSESAGVEFEFPKEAFDEGGGSVGDAAAPVPSLFLNSEQFRSYPKLWKATRKLVVAAGKQSKHHVLKGTGHQNFAEAFFWVPKFVLSRLRPVIGPANPVDAYREILDLTSEFMEQLE